MSLDIFCTMQCLLELLYKLRTFEIITVYNVFKTNNIHNRSVINYLF